MCPRQPSADVWREALMGVPPSDVAELEQSREIDEYVVGHCAEADTDGDQENGILSEPGSSVMTTMATTQCLQPPGGGELIFQDCEDRSKHCVRAEQCLRVSHAPFFRPTKQSDAFVASVRCGVSNGGEVHGGARDSGGHNG